MQDRTSKLISTRIDLQLVGDIWNYHLRLRPGWCSKGEQLLVTFAAGYIAGVFCAIVSHPADVVVSKLNQAKGSSALDVAKQLGFMGMWNGLMPRIIMIGTLTALQWFIYDGVKVALNIPRPPPPEMPESLKKKLGVQ
ncbi:mitochondrial phosphate carrier protein [Culex quinquefasciatus]|uniref:Mitochondrial phosphate carrier protein n=1 Tax=Culex quinquefasciatus TaxID=7176 RepID=B0X1E0_CULQU|nr:mitochondrial phosphate carrier protein [Culex quinquefasciatus]|eukprot:XP_001863462.1 mitochondrial phosphate carrier protein [Culex quinquefasciatus]